MENKAAHIVTGASKLVSIEDLLRKTGREKLSSRRKNHKLLMFYKMQNDLCSEYLTSLIPPTVGNKSKEEGKNQGSIQSSITSDINLYE